jgi:protein SCO1/2
MRRALLVMLALASLAARAHVGPHPETGIAFDQHPGARVPMTDAFVDSNGAHTTLGQAIGRKPTVLVMGYARCKDLCALTVPGAAEALDRAGLVPGRDYEAVFASIDPREDAATLAQVADRVPAADRVAWHILGGDDRSVRALAEAVGFRYRYEPDRDAYAHPEGVAILSPDGVVSRYFFGVRFDSGDVRDALREAGRGRTGGLTQQLLLLCYHFDPATGRYTVRILDALRIVIGLCALGAMVYAWRLTRRTRTPGGAA